MTLRRNTIFTIAVILSMLSGLITYAALRKVEPAQRDLPPSQIPFETRYAPEVCPGLSERIASDDQLSRVEWKLDCLLENALQRKGQSGTP